MDAGYALTVVRYNPPAEGDARRRRARRERRCAFSAASAALHELDADRFIAWGSAGAGWFAVMLG